mmetsp:Transcript_5056/g.6538  ORF Transcript_5056/g.6538 Transcript_5056/m.6538 type:complete len:491 (+) Transcript_5056:225-1697(+)
MGNLLVSPVTDKSTHRGKTSDGELDFAVSSMQGWRVHMEDAHICEPELFAEELVGETVEKAPAVSTKRDESEDSRGLVKKAKMNESPSSNVGGGGDNETPSGDDDSKMKQPETDDSKQSTDQTYRKIELPNHSLFAVFDGHGGSFAAEYSGLNFVRVFSRQPAFIEYARFFHEHQAKASTEETTPTEQAQIQRHGVELIEKAFRDAFLDIDREIWRVVNHLKNKDYILPSKKTDADNYDDANGESEEDSYHFDHQDSGTTAVVVMFTPEYIICANAGDSRSVYSKQGNCAIPLSYDHKPDDEEEERRIVEAGGFVRVGRVDGDLAVSRGLGDFRFKVNELYKLMGTASVADMPFLNEDNRTKKRERSHEQYVILPDDQKVSPVPDIVVQKRDRELDEFVVVACDGIFDVQTNHECVSMTAQIFQDGESDIGLVCEEIIDMCLEKGSKDNMTALVVKFHAQPVGNGGGVARRRELRQEAAEEEDKSSSELR